MITIGSKYEDVQFLGGKIKSLLNDKIKIGQYGKYKEILAGVYLKDPDEMSLHDGVDFEVRYNRNNFISLITQGQTYDERLEALFAVGGAISVTMDDRLIGDPYIFYNMRNRYLELEPCYSWIFANEDQYLQYLDNDLVEDLIIMPKKEQIYAKKLIYAKKND